MEQDPGVRDREQAGAWADVPAAVVAAGAAVSAPDREGLAYVPIAVKR